MLRVYFIEELCLSLLYLVAAVSLIPLTRALADWLRSHTRHDENQK